MKEKEEGKREPYIKPELTKVDNLKDITLADCAWSCSFSW